MTTEPAWFVVIPVKRADAGKSRLAHDDTRPALARAIALDTTEAVAATGRDRADIDTLMEVKVSYRDEREQAIGNTRFWAPLALSPEEKMGIHDPIEMQRRGDSCRSSGRRRGSSSRRTPTSTWRGSPATSSWASATSCSTTREPTRRSSCGCTGPRSCRGCGRASASDPRSDPDRRRPHVQNSGHSRRDAPTRPEGCR